MKIFDSIGFKFTYYFVQFALDVDDSTFDQSIRRVGRYKLIYSGKVNIRVSHHTAGVDDPFVVIDRVSNSNM